MDLKKGFKDFWIITGGVLLVTAGIYFFKFPNNFSTGGVSGISVVLSGLFPGFSPGTLVLIINLALLVLGLLTLGRAFAVKTVYASVLMSVLLRVLEVVWPMEGPLTGQPMLELIFAVLLPAMGSAILFHRSASTGGTDVVAALLQKHTQIHIGKSLLITDSAIVVLCFLVFGAETGLFSALGLVMKTLVVDSVIESFNLCKCFTIITTKPEEICQYIEFTLHRGATIYEATGAFTKEGKTVVLTVMPRFQAAHLQRHVRELDPNAFVMITNSSEIVGKGFRGTSFQ